MAERNISNEDMEPSDEENEVTFLKWLRKKPAESASCTTITAADVEKCISKCIDVSAQSRILKSTLAAKRKAKRQFLKLQQPIDKPNQRSPSSCIDMYQPRVIVNRLESLPRLTVTTATPRCKSSSPVLVKKVSIKLQRIEQPLSIANNYTCVQKKSRPSSKAVKVKSTSVTSRIKGQTLLIKQDLSTVEVGVKRLNLTPSIKSSSGPSVVVEKYESLLHPRTQSRVGSSKVNKSTFHS